MKYLINLFKIIELSRSQPQTGYVLHSIQQNELSNLAEHHYLVAFIAWQLASNLQNLGAKINVVKVLEFALVHDLGELFGGDISMPYAQINPEARRHAKDFEAENQKFLSKFFGPQADYFKALSAEVLNFHSDEAAVAKIADYLEVTHYLLYMGVTLDSVIDSTKVKIEKMISGIKDPVANKELTNFIEVWAEDLQKGTALDALRGE
ncbi:HD domain-containing protein [Candidatus Wolfebacteria bacterium]|nr:HD domain-containing protein [Candidatus Wolfebacteria bacterium]